MTDKWIRSSSRFIFKFGKPSSSTTTSFHQSTSTTTHFGFQQIDEEEKQKRVKTVFANVAHKYDLMNDAMSFCIHRLWKDYYVQKLRLTKDCRVLDVAGGTGDITFRIVDKLQRLPRGSATVTVADINEKMLDNGKIRASKLDSKSARECINWVTADAESLPFADNSFDIYTIAFGIRNCTHIDKVIDEAFRVLKPGGTFSCLEFGPVNRPIFGKIYRKIFQIFQIIPVMGQIFVGDFNSYKYLVESIRLFPNQQKFSAILKEAGFENVTYEELTGGICNIFMAKKPKNKLN